MPFVSPPPLFRSGQRQQQTASRTNLSPIPTSLITALSPRVTSLHPTTPYFTTWRLMTLQGHEVYRAWVALRETESGKEFGVQGFLKLSVTVLGPGDRQRVHDLAEEIQVGPTRRGQIYTRGDAEIRCSLSLLGVMTGAFLMRQKFPSCPPHLPPSSICVLALSPHPSFLPYPCFLSHKATRVLQNINRWATSHSCSVAQLPPPRKRCHKSVRLFSDIYRHFPNSHLQIAVGAAAVASRHAGGTG